MQTQTQEDDVAFRDVELQELCVVSSDQKKSLLRRPDFRKFCLFFVLLSALASAALWTISTVSSRQVKSANARELTAETPVLFGEKCDYIRVMFNYAGYLNTNEAYAGCEPNPGADPKEGSSEWWESAKNMRRVSEFPSLMGIRGVGGATAGWVTLDNKFQYKQRKLNTTKAKRDEIDTYFETNHYTGCVSANVLEHAAEEPYDNSWVNAHWKRDNLVTAVSPHLEGGGILSVLGAAVTGAVQSTNSAWRWMALYKKVTLDAAQTVCEIVA